MAERYDERYYREPYRGERAYARDERGFDPRVSNEIRPSFDEEEAAREREAGEAERRRAREADRLYRRDYGPYDYGWGSERRWAERNYGPRRYGYRGETGRDTSWSGPSSSTYGQDTSQYLPWYDVTEGGDERWRRGPFAGRGPKGYQRSDDRILEDVSDRLTDAPFLDASDIEVTVNSGEVTLSGTVPSREQKRRSEDLIEYVTGVREVHNRLRVSRASEGTNVGP